MLHLGLLLVLIIADVVGLYIMINGNDAEVGKYIIIIITGLVSLIAFPLITVIALLIWFIYLKYSKEESNDKKKIDG